MGDSFLKASTYYIEPTFTKRCPVCGRTVEVPCTSTFTMDAWDWCWHNDKKYRSKYNPEGVYKVQMETVKE